MRDHEHEFDHWRNVIGEKLINGELQDEGILALDKKLRRIYAIGYYLGRLDSEKYANRRTFND